MNDRTSYRSSIRRRGSGLLGSVFALAAVAGISAAIAAQASSAVGRPVSDDVAATLVAAGADSTGPGTGASVCNSMVLRACPSGNACSGDNYYVYSSGGAKFRDAGTVFCGGEGGCSACASIRNCTDIGVDQLGGELHAPGDGVPGNAVPVGLIGPVD